MNSSAISRGDPKPRSFPRAVSLTCWRQSSPNKHWTCPRLESHRLTSGALPYRRTNSLALMLQVRACLPVVLEEPGTSSPCRLLIYM